MPRVEFNKPTPEFTLEDFRGNPVSLANYRGKSNVVLIFNRGFF